MSDRVLGVHVMCNSLVEEWAESDQECVWGEGSVRGLLATTEGEGSGSPHSPLSPSSTQGMSTLNGGSIGLMSSSHRHMSPAASLSLPWSPPTAKRSSGGVFNISGNTTTTSLASTGPVVDRLPSLSDVIFTIDQFNSRNNSGSIKGGMGVCIRRVALPNPSNHLSSKKESSEARLGRLGAALLIAHQGGVVNDEEDGFFFTQGVRNMAKASQLDIRAAVWRYWWNQLTAMMPSSSFASLDAPHTVIVLLILVPRGGASQEEPQQHFHPHPQRRMSSPSLVDWKMLLSWRSFLEAHNRIMAINSNPDIFTTAVHVVSPSDDHNTVTTRAAQAKLLSCTTTSPGSTSSSSSSHHLQNGFYNQAILDVHVSCLVATLEATCCGGNQHLSQSTNHPSSSIVRSSQTTHRHRQYKGAWDVLFLLEEHQKLLEETLLNVLGTLVIRAPNPTTMPSSSSSLEDSNDGVEGGDIRRPMGTVVRRRLGLIAEQIAQCVLEVEGNKSTRPTMNNILSLFEYKEDCGHRHEDDEVMGGNNDDDTHRRQILDSNTTTTKNVIGDIMNANYALDGSQMRPTLTSLSPTSSVGSFLSLSSSSIDDSDSPNDDGNGEGAMHVVDKVVSDYSILDDGKHYHQSTAAPNVGSVTTTTTSPPPGRNSNEEGLSALLQAEEDSSARAIASSAPQPKPRPNIKYLSENDGYEVVDKSGVFFDEKAGLIDRQYMQVSAVFIKNAIPLAACHTASTGLEKAATKHNMRILTNGGLEPPDSGIVGYYDYSTTPQELKCRETAFTRKNFGVIAATCTEFVKLLDTVYKQNAPLHHQLQKSAAPPEYQLFDTAFSTLTVNKNFRTAAHTDQGDFKSGFGVVSVLSGEYGGCHLAIPKLNKAFNIRPGDVLLFDTSLEHGNTEVHCPNYSWERVSVVAYLRTKLLSSMCEQERHIRRLRRLQKPLKAFKSATDAADVVDLRKLFFNNKYNSAANGIPIASSTTPAPISASTTITSSGSPVYLPRRLLQFLTPTQVSALLFAGARLSSRTIRRGGSTSTESGGGCVIGLPMGHGKTLLALTLAFSHLHEFPLDDVLIVTPKSVIPHWRAEAVKWASKGGLFFRSFISRDEHDTQWDLALMYYNQQTISEEIPKVGHLFVINAESLSSLHKRCPKLAPSMILVDEGHKVGTGGSDSQLVQILMRMSKGGHSNSSGSGGSPALHKGGSTLSNSNSVAGYGSNARRVVFTGTPLQNSAMEIYTLVEFVCPVIFRVYPRVIFNQKVEIIERYIRSVTLQDLAKATPQHSSITSKERGSGSSNEGHTNGGISDLDEARRLSSQQPKPMVEGSSQLCSIDVDAQDDEEAPQSSCLSTSAPQQLPSSSLQQRRRDLEEAVDAQTFVVNWMQGFVFRDLSSGYVDHAKPNEDADATRRPAMASQKGKGDETSSGVLGEGPVVDPVASAAALPLYDFIIVCGSSQAQTELLQRYDLAGNIATAQSVLRAVEHRPFHIGAHPLTFYNFLLHRDRNSKAAILSTSRKRSQIYKNGDGADDEDSDSIDSDVEFMLDNVHPSQANIKSRPTTTSSLPLQSIGSKRSRQSTAGSSKTLDLPREEIKFLETCVASSLRIRGSGTSSSPSHSPHHPTLPLNFLSLSGKLTTCVAIVLRAMRLKGGKKAADHETNHHQTSCQNNNISNDKILIFSQYVQIQLLLVATFEALGVGCVHISGQDSTTTRKEAVERFRGNSSSSSLSRGGGPTVMIASTKAAAFGLDLTVANHVIMFDSWWNPQLDAQAIARVRRTNQTKPVFVYRLASEYEDAIILSAHRKKIALFECVINGRSIDDIFGPIAPPPASAPHNTTTTAVVKEEEEVGEDKEDVIDSSTDRDTYQFLLTLKKHQKLSTDSISKKRAKKIPTPTNVTTTTTTSCTEEKEDEEIVARPAVVAVQTYASLMKGLTS